ncbi:MAG TPA: diaminopimelate epimerase [Thermoplasmata archaeon]|jgi:diaminopimelate epimerase
MTKEFRFVKYQGCGNDFIIKDETEGPVTPDAERSRLAKALTDRHFKVGADGIIFVERAKGVAGSMRLFEPAGNEADMCGNGIRCVAAYLSKKLGKPEVDILTRDGVKHIVKVGEEYRVDMGIVRTTRKDLAKYVADKGSLADSMLSFDLVVSGNRVKGSIVNSGEPHIVVRSMDVSKEDVVAAGEALNGDKTRFPDGVNLNFVQVVGPHALRVRTYERGVYDETLACGTGATACAAVALMLKWVQPGPVKVMPPGGTMTIELAEDGRAFMTGPAEAEFEGRLAV